MQAKNFVKADNGERLTEKDDRSSNTGGPRRPSGSYRNSGNGYNQKENDIYMKRMHQARNKREEVVPRFQVIFLLTQFSVLDTSALIIKRIFIYSNLFCFVFLGDDDGDD